MPKAVTPTAILVVWLILPVAAAAQVAAAEVPATLSLHDAVDLALQHNPGLVAAGHASAGAAEGVTQARARFVPKVDVMGTASRTDNPTMVFSNLLGQARFGPNNFAISSLNEPDPLTNFNTRLMVFQPLYAGGQIRAGLSASRHMQGAARGQERRARQETIYQAIHAYQEVLLARRQGRVALAAREAAQSHLRMAESLVAGGLAVPSDVLRVKVRLAEIEEMVIRAGAGEQVARAALEAVMGVRPERAYDLEEPEEAAGGGTSPADADEAARTALRLRPDLAAAREGAVAAGEGVRAALGGRLPQAGFAGAYEINNDTPIGSSGKNWTAMVMVSANLFDGRGGASRVRQSREEEARAGSLVSGFESQVVLEVRQSQAELAGAVARREAARAAVKQAEEGLRIVRDRYENGLAPITDLLDQETALTDARARAAQAEYDRRDGEAALALAMGSLDAAGAPEEVHP